MPVKGWEHLNGLPKGVRIAKSHEMKCCYCCEVYISGDDVKYYCPQHDFDTKLYYTCPKHMFYRRDEEE